LDAESTKRYTELPFVLQALHTRELTLVSPKSWDDKNDAYAIEQYRRKRGLGSVLALCLTDAEQTHHHWKVFTHGSSGACIHFHPDQFGTWLAAQAEIQGRPVIYRSVAQLRSTLPPIEDLPFIKRAAYEPEREFRLLHGHASRTKRTHALPFNLSMIRRIVLSPWMPVPTFEASRAIIHGINGCSSMPVNRATIVESADWRKLIKRAAA